MFACAIKPFSVLKSDKWRVQNMSNNWYSSDEIIPVAGFGFLPRGTNEEIEFNAKVGFPYY